MGISVKVAYGLLIFGQFNTLISFRLAYVTAAAAYLLTMDAASLRLHVSRVSMVIQIQIGLVRIETSLAPKDVEASMQHYSWVM